MNLNLQEYTEGQVADAAWFQLLANGVMRSPGQRSFYTPKLFIWNPLPSPSVHLSLLYYSVVFLECFCLL